MLIAAVDICNTIADVLTEIQNIIGPWPFNEYHHPLPGAYPGKYKKFFGG